MGSQTPVGRAAEHLESLVWPWEGQLGLPQQGRAAVPVMKRGMQKETQEQSAAVPAAPLEAGQAGWACWAPVAVHLAALLKAVPLHTPCTHCCQQERILCHKKEKRETEELTLLSGHDGSLLRQKVRATDSVPSTCVLEQDKGL